MTNVFVIIPAIILPVLALLWLTCIACCVYRSLRKSFDKGEARAQEDFEGGYQGDQTALSLIFATPSSRHASIQSQSSRRSKSHGGFFIRGTSRVSDTGSSRSSGGGNHSHSIPATSLPEVAGDTINFGRQMSHGIVSSPAVRHSPSYFSQDIVGIGGRVQRRGGSLDAGLMTPLSAPYQQQQFPPIQPRKISDQNRIPTGVKNFLENHR